MGVVGFIKVSLEGEDCSLKVLVANLEVSKLIDCDSAFKTCQLNHFGGVFKVALCWQKDCQFKQSKIDMPWVFPVANILSVNRLKPDESRQLLMKVVSASSQLVKTEGYKRCRNQASKLTTFCCGGKHFTASEKLSKLSTTPSS